MDRQEILRYLGAPKSNPQLDQMIDRAESEIEAAASPRHVWGLYSLSVEREGVVLGGT